MDNLKTKTSKTDSVQFGEGNFMRAFVDYSIQLLNEETEFEGRVDIIQPIEKGMIDELVRQDGKYHIFFEGIVNGEEIREKHLINCIDQLINPYKDYPAYLKLAENENLTFIFSNTTEAGITFEPDDNINSKPPSSFPAKLLAFLYHRYKRFNGDPAKSVHIIPCELIENNGIALKKILLRISDQFELENDFKNWLSLNHFYNTLVDRIVPGYPKNNIDFYKSKLTFDDKLMVTCEPFFLWIIEGDQKLLDIFPADQLEKINVIVVPDLGMYRTRKVRILNGCHTCMVPLGLLNGNETVSSALNDSFVKNIITKILFDEIIPSINYDQEELKKYADSVLERFANPFIIHKLESISLNSISKFKVRVLPSILSFIKISGFAPKALSFAMATLIYFYSKKISLHSIDLKDDPSNIDFFNSVWINKSIENIIEKILSNDSLWGENLVKKSSLKKNVTEALKIIKSNKSIEDAYNSYENKIT